jgi:hypothetical protein
MIPAFGKLDDLEKLEEQQTRDWEEQREARRKQRVISAQTVATWMDLAIGKIDRLFGEGYAKANPALVGKFIECCTLNLHLEDISSTLEDLSGNSFVDFDATRKFGDIAKAIDKLANVMDLKR